VRDVIVSEPMMGDVVLMNGKPGIRAAQWAVRWSKCRFSHAAISISAHTYIDSVTKGGVALRRWSELDEDMPIAVYRYLEHPLIRLEKVEEIIRHYGKRYNYAFRLSNWPILSARFGESLFCSEFVAKIYTRAELGLPDNKRAVLPVDLETLAHNPSWFEVTEFYTPYIRGKVPETGEEVDQSIRVMGESEMLFRRMEREFPDLFRASPGL